MNNRLKKGPQGEKRMVLSPVSAVQVRAKYLKTQLGAAPVATLGVVTDLLRKRENKTTMLDS